MVAVSFLDLLAFMRAEGVKHWKAQNVGAFFQQGVLAKLYKAAKVLHAAVGPREVLYMPYAIVGSSSWLRMSGPTRTCWV